MEDEFIAGCGLGLVLGFILGMFLGICLAESKMMKSAEIRGYATEISGEILWNSDIEKAFKKEKE